jgi:hypothetical protein
MVHAKKPTQCPDEGMGIDKKFITYWYASTDLFSPLRQLWEVALALMLSKSCAEVAAMRESGG